jgi:hypothetical protein
MTSLTITPELIGLLVNIVALIGGFIKLESRLTRLETTQNLMLKGLIDTKQVERRAN